MKIQSYPRHTFKMYSDQQLKLAENQEALSSFIGLPFNEENFIQQIQLKKIHFTPAKRECMVNAFHQQYEAIEPVETITNNISLLALENTFTITTGHQLTLFGGPSYFMYKILHVISLCQKLNVKYASHHFVPVFWMATEDHDKEEISETTIYNKKLRWETNETGATGNFSLNNEFELCKEEFIRLFSSAEFDEIQQKIQSFSGNSLAEGMFHFIHAIFQKYGLLILDPNKQILKKEMIPIFEKEINESVTFKSVSKTNQWLLDQEITPQAQIQPINLFYLQEGKRSKISPSENGFTTNEISFTKSQILEEINNHPEFFSPNVFLRPIYQELILPNLAYVGGPGELNYWMQLKGIFDAFSIPYPILVNRVSLFIIEKPLLDKFKKFDFSFLDYANFTKEDLRKTFLLSNKETIDWNGTQDLIDQAQESAKVLFEKFAPGNTKMVDAEWKSIEKSVNQLIQKLEKQTNLKYSVSLNQIEQIKDKLFPNGSTQERVVHFFQYCSNGSLKNLDEILEDINPFESNILLIQV